MFRLKSLRFRMYFFATNIFHSLEISWTFSLVSTIFRKKLSLAVKCKFWRSKTTDSVPTSTYPITCARVLIRYERIWTWKSKSVVKGLYVIRKKKLKINIWRANFTAGQVKVRFVIFPFRFVMREILFKVYVTSLTTLFFKWLPCAQGLLLQRLKLWGKRRVTMPVALSKGGGRYWRNLNNQDEGLTKETDG